MVPMLTGRMWYSTKLGWIYMVGYMIGTAMVVVGFDALGLAGLIRRAEIYPIIPAYVTPEVVASVGAMIADFATLIWLGNLVITLLKGRSANVEGLSVSDTVTTIAMQLGYEGPSLNEISNKLTTAISRIVKIKA
jgi:cytochrome c oxidase subunit 1/terminal oxidase heme-binding subunit I